MDNGTEEEETVLRLMHFSHTHEWLNLDATAMCGTLMAFPFFFLSTASASAKYWRIISAGANVQLIL